MRVLLHEYNLLVFSQNQTGAFIPILAIEIPHRDQSWHYEWVWTSRILPYFVLENYDFFVTQDREKYNYELYLIVYTICIIIDIVINEYYSTLFQWLCILSKLCLTSIIGTHALLLCHYYCGVSGTSGMLTMPGNNYHIRASIPMLLSQRDLWDIDDVWRPRLYQGINTHVKVIFTLSQSANNSLNPLFSKIHVCRFIK